MDKRTGNSSEDMVVPGSEAVSPVRSSRHYVWVAVAALVLLGGITAAALGAHSAAQDDAAHSQRVFEHSADRVVSTLQLAIQHEEDLMVNATAFIHANPDATPADFTRWLSSVSAYERYPELDELAELILVPKAELPAFQARASLFTDVSQTPSAEFEVAPSGDRPYYCFATLGSSRVAEESLPQGFDYCAIPIIGEAVLEARDSGRSSYRPVTIHAGKPLLAVQVPIFRGGLVPATLEDRRATFMGVFGMTLNQTLVLDRALAENPGLSVSMRYAANSSDVTYSSGSSPKGGTSITADLQNGWTVQVSGSDAADGVFANVHAFSLLIAGVAASSLLAVLVLVLGTGRARAMRLVTVKTRELRYQALHDPLTGLPNRALITDRVDQLLARNRRNGTQGAALFLDLDEFKNVNDTLGHQAGDRLLMGVAARLKSTLRDADTIGRLGGDEFVVLIDGVSVDVAPELVAERLLDVMRQPFDLAGAAMPLLVNVSIGIAVGDRPDGGDLLRDADVALYEAKSAGKNRYETFQPEMQTEISRRIELEFDLRSALDSEQFRLVYQPIYNLDDMTVVGVEALLRWDHPTMGTIEPDEFIPILEQTGQIREVGRWVLRQACEQMAAWHARGDAMDVSVNVSGRQLESEALVEHIREALDVSGLAATSLIVEVTETALMRNADATARRLHVIKDLGVRVAVDDFGTGYSSLAYLRKFPVDCLKIDRTFTAAIATSAESKALIRTLVQLGKDLGLKTLAEGVETSGEFEHLRGEHVNEAQGFFFARPLDPETLEATLLAPARRARPAA